jgi:hypothetical protein
VRTEPPALHFPMTRPSLTPSAFDASDSAPPVQPPSFGPGASGPASRRAKAKRYVATAVGVCTVAIVTGVATVDFASWSGGGHSVATSTPTITESGERTEKAGGPAEVAAVARPVVETQVITRPAPAASEPAPAPAASDLPSIPLADYEGVLRVPARAAQHRIFVDGHVIGEGAGDFPVRCGTRAVRVGSKGDERQIEIPCGRVVAIE